MPPDDRIAEPNGDNCRHEPIEEEPAIANDLARQVSELGTALQATAVPIREVVDAFQEGWSAFMAQISELGEEFRRVDWNSIQARADADTLRLADVGWTVPYWLTPRQVAELSEADPALADAWFTELYLGTEDRLTRVAASLEHSSRLAKWQPLLQQTCAAIRRGDHLLAVPSLFLMIEGFVAQLADPTRLSQVRDTNVVRLLGQVEPAKRRHITSVIWASTRTFVARLFGSTDFASDGPTFLNRHWILHGRRGADWSVADALRLLNALSTLEWLMRWTDKFESGDVR
jgi:hypothetical protein